MKKGGIDKDTTSGLDFEEKVELTETLLDKGYLLGASVIGKTLHDASGPRGLLFKKGDLYKFLRNQGVDYEALLSKKLLPDNVFINYGTRTAFIIEVKYQITAGSVDEKLQTCHFKLGQYRKLLEPAGYRVNFCYVLNAWFRKDEYRDTLNYIQECGCRFFFREIDVAYLGL